MSWKDAAGIESPSYVPPGGKVWKVKGLGEISSDELREFDNDCAARRRLFKTYSRSEKKQYKAAVAGADRDHHLRTCSHSETYTYLLQVRRIMFIAIALFIISLLINIFVIRDYTDATYRAFEEGVNYGVTYATYRQ